jgi:MFS family permease
VGFYYMANACGRLLGTLLSGVLYQMAGVSASLWGAVVLAAIAGIAALFLPPVTTEVAWAGVKSDD